MTAAETDSSLHRGLLARIETLTSQRPVMWAANLGMMAFAAYVVSPYQPMHLLVAWWGSNALFAAIRLYDRHRLARQWPLAPAAAQRWMREFVFSTTLGGAIWGVGGYAFLVTDDFFALLLFLLTLSGVATGSVGNLASSYGAIMGFAIPITVLTALGIWHIALPQAHLLVILTLAYLVFILAVGRNYSRAVTAVITRDLENLELLGEVREQKERAEQANREKSLFLAAVSHDLRQPLYAMGLFIDTLRTRLNQSKQLELHDEVRHSHAVLKDLFDALLEISRLDAASVEVDKSDLELSSLVDEIVKEFQPFAREKHVDLHHEKSELVVFSDPVLLARIIRNVLSNAVKFTDAGSIVVYARNTGEHVRLSIQDTGCGIAQSDQAQIFSEYFQVRNRNRDRSRGLGLGLAVVRRLSALLDIDVSFESEINQGTSFHLDLKPGERGNVASRDTIVVDELSIAGLHVVVIDDELAVLRGLVLLFSDNDCVVTNADNAQDALEGASMQSRVPDVVVSDFRLADGETGLDAISVLREHFDPELPALLISGDTDPHIRELAQRVNVTLLSKPVDAQELVNTIAKMV
ncbi:MAG: ATP-binding protein [Pseudomonadota bacterium]